MQSTILHGLGPFCCLPHGRSTFAGTVAWMAPEMIRMNGPITEKVDVYSYGIIIWELLTQEAPFAGCHVHNIMWLVGAQGKRPPVPEDTPAPLKDLLSCCWKDNAAERPSFSKIITLVAAMGKLDDQLESQLHEFNLSCAVWQHEINVALDGYKAMQEKHAQLADRVAELELREQLVQEKEAAVQMQLDSLRFAGGMPPGTMVGSLATLTSRPDSQGSRPKHPTKWSESEVYTWVSTLVCEDVRQYCNCFQGNNINGQ